MNVLLRSLLIAACLASAGCSALSDFSGYDFDEPDDDGGTDEDPTAGEGGASGEGGTSGEGGEGGTSGTGTDPECTGNDDCEGNEMCTNEMCVPIRIPSGVLQSAGGGDTASTNYSMRISIGVPQPMGRVSSSNFIVTVGPGSGRP